MANIHKKVKVSHLLIIRFFKYLPIDSAKLQNIYSILKRENVGGNLILRWQM